jgi:hypothetical protein
MDPLANLTRVLGQQDGVVSRIQVLGAGGDDVLIERMIRQRRWSRVHPGVYVDHTGPLGWDQGAWAAVLYSAPAALAGRSALRAHGVRGQDVNVEAEIEVVVDHRRRVRRVPGLRIDRLVYFDRVVQSHLSPPRVTIEHALLRIASTAQSEDSAVAVLADGCQSRRTTPARLAAELDETARIPRRRFLSSVLDDVAEGANSALERRYLNHVERAHKLPRACRQRRDAGAGGPFRDVVYPAQATIVELDGRLGHEWAAERWDDLDRDIDGAASGRLTVRAGWRQVLQPCRLAVGVARILVARGWDDRLRPCGPSCSLA